MVNTVTPFKEIASLFAGSEPRILAIDPDFSDWQLPNDIIDAIPNLKAICLQTTGYNWVDVKHAREKGIAVTQLVGFSSIAVAEWATFMTLAVARRVPVLMADQWKLDYEAHRGFELRGKTAGIIGLGRIGKAVAENMAGLGMKVQYWSKNSRDDRFAKADLRQLLSSSDVILPTVAINDETRTLIREDMLDLIPKTSVIVSVVEPIFDQASVVKRVQSGLLAGYAYEDEKGPIGKHGGNIWNGPALGWCTNESMSKNGELWVQCIVQAARNEFPTRVA